LISSKPLSEISLLLRRTQRDIVIKVHTSSYKVPVVFFLGTLTKLNLSKDFSKNNHIPNLINTHIPNLIKIRPVGAELLHADGRTDGRTEGQTDMT
jgi:hypothetical protein